MSRETSKQFKFSDLSPIAKGAIIFGLLLAAFLGGALVGYIRGISGDGGSSDRAIEWMLKTGFLCFFALLLSFPLANAPRFVLVYFMLPQFVYLAIGTGFFFAVTEVASILIGITSGDLWLSALNQFVTGLIGGGLGGILFEKTNTPSKSDSRNS